MEKHNNMVLQNKERSQAKVDKAIKAIHKMLNSDEQVVVCTLVKKTGLSRAFFYNNETVHAELQRAQELQEGKSFIAPQKLVINKAMDREIELLKKKIEERDSLIASQQREIARLKKALEAQSIKALADL